MNDKRLIFSVLAVIFAVLSACNNPAPEAGTNNADSLKAQVTPPPAQAINLVPCLEEGGDHCTPECLERIFWIHNISLERFQYVTRNHQGNPKHSYSGNELTELTESVNNHDCDGNVLIDASGIITFNPSVPTIYSTPLFKAIIAMNPTRIEVHEATDLKTDEPEMILKVDFAGTIRYFDISDYHP